MGIRDLFHGKSNSEIIKRNEKENSNVEETQVNQSASQNQTSVEASDLETEEQKDSEETSISTFKDELTKVAQQYNGQRESLQSLLFDKQTSIQKEADQLNTEKANAQKLVDDAGTQVTKIQNEMEKETQDASAPLVKKQSELSAKIKENQDQAGSLIDQVQEINEELAGLNKKQQQLVQSEKDISAKFESEKDPAVIVTLADQYRDDIENNKDEREKNATTISAVEEKQQDLKSQLQTVRDKLTTDQKELRDVNNQLEEVQLKIASDDEGRSKHLDALTQELTKNQDELAKLQGHLDEKNKELAAANQEIAGWLGVSVPVKQLKFGEDSEIIVDMDGVDDEQFAQLKSAIKVITDRGAGRIGLYTSQFKLNLTSQIAKWTTELQVKGGVVSVYNPLYSLQHQGELGAKYQLPDNAVTDEWNDDHTERTLVLDNGWTLKAHYFDQSDAVSTVDSYKGDHLAESSTLTREGQLTANRFYNDDGTKNRDEYYSQSGLGILNVRYEQDELIQVELLNAVGMQVQAFDSIDGFADWWLKTQFNQSGLLLGTLNNEHYRELLRVTHGEPIALVTGSDMKRDEFTDWTKALSKQQYLADNYATKMKLIQALNQPLTISLMDPRNLPVSLGVPVGE
ncbi:hypothetical protein [Secundilactobacillus mixtipabuli]|uniref:Uncharacterized protein n=1 Tax=Secundilactobacillus mixtipabuli TaxID=1435342 RepID=A0A1Z5I9C6_9LACO|nr:hypothetical protein [Secundilactobacillus mixtipabuli]GAW98211.1 hypothetical protein IWT30_00154 [Secundilactobacillus mixtipabuli]